MPPSGPPTASMASERSRSRSRGPSQSPSRQSATSGRAPLGNDRETGLAPVLNRNVDLGGGAYMLKTGVVSDITKRPGFGKAGKPVRINVNSYRVTQFPDKDIIQYDVKIGSGAEPRGLNKAAWNSGVVQAKLGANNFIYDGAKQAWSLRNIEQELRVMIDLDAEKGKKPRKGKENKTVLMMRKSGLVRLENIHAYMSRGSGLDYPILDSINFLDHLLRETPSQTLISLRRSYFSRNAENGERSTLGGGVEAMKGVYQSMRLAEGRKLMVNVDVANSCFWQETTFDRLVSLVTGATNSQQLISLATIPPQGKPEAPMRAMIRRLENTRFRVEYKGNGTGKEYQCRGFTKDNAREHKVPLKQANGQTVEVSVMEYFKQRHKIHLSHPYLPLIKTQREKEVYPMELAHMCYGQRYLNKLNQDQTSAMIKFAATRPTQRKQAISAGLQKLNWTGDPVLKQYGLRINPSMVETNARILDPPEVLYADKATAKPMYSGRWDLRGKKFLMPANVLKSWGVCVLTGDHGGNRRMVPQMANVQAFVENFIKIYRGHGGRVENSKPVIIQGVPNIPDAIEQTFTAAGNQAKMRPQILMVILTNMSIDVYRRVKRNCDCRFGVMSQCVQAAHVLKNQPQYCSNVLMKFNLKLGGTTSATKSKQNPLTLPTMMIGADVSHPQAGASYPSVAAITVSMDRTCSRYAGAAQTNGFRTEMISTSNMVSMLRPLVQHWMGNVGGGRLPSHVYYFRDGVSENQYLRLRESEVADIKRVFSDLISQSNGQLPMPKFTIVVAEKRHHIRFFPYQGPASDKNGNPVPGIIVDRDVTHPFEYDFYLNSHAAIQGTSRPTHYHIVIDEQGVNIDQFQALLYEHCYQFQRATTPVSLFPAVYNAHLTATRGNCQIDDNPTRAWVERHQLLRRPGVPVKNPAMDSASEAPKLTPMLAVTQIDKGMWYI